MLRLRDALALVEAARRELSEARDDLARIAGRSLGPPLSDAAELAEIRSRLN